MNPPPRRRARAGKSGSKRTNMNEAQASMFDQTDIAITPSGAMSPVETSSPTTMSTSPSTDSGSAGGGAGATRFGPRSTATGSAPSPRGGMMIVSCPRGSGGGEGARSVATTPLGSVISPVMALAAAVDGLHRYTRSSAVPLRPGKLRLKVRSDGTPFSGAVPMPTHGPQMGSSILKPAFMRSSYTPDRAIVPRIWREPGVAVTCTPSATRRPRTVAATTARSS